MKKTVAKGDISETPGSMRILCISVMPEGLLMVEILVYCVLLKHKVHFPQPT